MRPRQPDSADGLVMFERIRGRIGGAQDLDVEAFEQAPGV